MKKNSLKTIAAAALLATASTATLAQTVEVYGVLDNFLASGRDGIGTDRVGSLNSGGLEVSRIGFRGTEDLGGGLKVSFVLESGLYADTGLGLSSGFDRHSALALESRYGYLAVGNQPGILDDVFDVSGAGVVFDSAFSPIYSTSAAWRNYRALKPNSIKLRSYELPVRGPLGYVTVGVSHELDEDGSARDGATDFGVFFNSATTQAQIGYQIQDSRTRALREEITAASITHAVEALGWTKLTLGWAEHKEDTTTGTDVYLGVEVPVSDRLAVAVGYARSSEKVAGFPQFTLRKSGAAIAATYSLSPRTTLYAGLSEREEEQGGVKTDSGSLVGVGIRHTF